MTDMDETKTTLSTNETLIANEAYERQCENVKKLFEEARQLPLQWKQKIEYKMAAKEALLDSTKIVNEPTSETLDAKPFSAIGKALEALMEENQKLTKSNTFATEELQQCKDELAKVSKSYEEAKTRGQTESESSFETALEVEKLRASVQALEGQRDALLHKLDSHFENRKIEIAAAVESAVEPFKSQISAVEKEKETLEKRLQNVEQELKASNTDVEKLKDELRGMQKVQEESDNLRSGLAKELEKKEAELEKTVTQKASILAKAKTLRAKFDEKVSMLKSRDETLSSLRGHYRALVKAAKTSAATLRRDVQVTKDSVLAERDQLSNAMESECTALKQKIFFLQATRAKEERQRVIATNSTVDAGNQTDPDDEKAAAQEAVKKLEKKINVYHKALLTSKQQVKKCEESIGKGAEVEKSLQAELTAEKTTTKELRAFKTQLEANVAKLQRDNASLMTRLKALLAKLKEKEKQRIEEDREATKSITDEVNAMSEIQRPSSSEDNSRQKDLALTEKERDASVVAIESTGENTLRAAEQVSAQCVVPSSPATAPTAETIVRDDLPQGIRSEGEENSESAEAAATTSETGEHTSQPAETTPEGSLAKRERNEQSNGEDECKKRKIE